MNSVDTIKAAINFLKLAFSEIDAAGFSIKSFATVEAILSAGNTKMLNN